ncbi:hypothetical protein OIU34_06360 [Pararhizobium sp. BT-229]|uniref:hypothetical protein n=1 Tax=Pararhizobium sp. BT-229 TaxID=2986923 RepID=UPI0021F6F448|nr:hypothetical protein [Pararhizobium sp. BT-229]MCV9961520.1 hypothetical protein [Pararhizobium sp. BT-229]
MKNSWFGTIAVPALEALLPRISADIRQTSPVSTSTGSSLEALRPFLGMAPPVQSLGDAIACLIFKQYLPIPAHQQSPAADKHAALQYRNKLKLSALKSDA